MGMFRADLADLDLRCRGGGLCRCVHREGEAARKTGRVKGSAGHGCFLAPLFACCMRNLSSVLWSMKLCPLACLLICVSACALPAWCQDSKVTVQKDVAYLPEGRAEKADLYLPVDDGTRHPAVLIVHGGGWSGGKRDAAREINIGTTLASHGYVCLSIDYQLHDPQSDKSCWPQNLYDCKTAVRWLRANAERLHLDTKHIGVIGGSAGGHLSSMVGVTGPSDGLDPPGPYGDQSCAVNCVVDL